jgi:predicted dehydrogenase
MLEELQVSTSKIYHRRPRLGFAGVGWIGRHRLNAVAASGTAEVVAIADLRGDTAAEVSAGCPGATAFGSFEELLDQDLDGVVIATPSALHASQAIAALERGIAVFCQKPLGRDAAETRAVIAAAKKADQLLGVDLSYRHTAGMMKIRELIRSGELGEILAIQAVFHNAYGPDKPWFYSKELAGGGCLLDLGIHLVDLAMWCIEFPSVVKASGWKHESCCGEAGDRVEDHAAGQLVFDQGTCLQLACSWRSHAGCDAEIRIEFFGTCGGVCFRNTCGSFYDFVTERYHSDRSRELLAGPPDVWGGRAVLDWVNRLGESSRFDPEISKVGRVAAALDLIYKK